MKVLLLSQHFWPESFRINDVAQSLAEAGCEVEVLTGQPNYPAGRVFDGYRAWGTGQHRHGSVLIHRVPLAPRGRSGALRLALNYLSFVCSASLFGSWRLRGRRFDVVFVYGTSPVLQAIAGVWLAWLKGCPLVLWVQDLWPQSLEVTGYVKNRRVLQGVSRIVSWIYHHCDLLLVQSPSFEGPVRRLAPAAVPICYHPNPGDKESGTPPAAPAPRLGDGFKIVFAGNLGTAQGLDTVLDAAQRLRDLADVRIVLVGSGQRSEWLAQQIVERRLDNVTMTGRLDTSAMPEVLAQADVLLVTLKPDPTMALTLPSKVQSYLAAGRPIVAALDGEGVRVLRESGAGLSCPPGEPAALAETLRRMHDLPAEQRQQMGARGHAYHAEHFEPHRLAGELMRKLAWAVEQRRSATSDNNASRKSVR